MKGRAGLGLKSALPDFLFLKMQNPYQKAILIITLVALTGCGLPTVAYLYKPSDFEVGTALLTIKNSPNNYEPSEGEDQTFLGIEIYYRVYQTDAAAETALANLSALADLYEDKPSQFETVVSSSGYGFRPLKRHDGTRPFLTIDSDDISRYYLYFDEWHLVDSQSTLIDEVQRNFDESGTGSSNYFQKGDFRSGDPDYSGTGSPSATTRVYIVFFAVSYGLDITSSATGQEVFSDPYIPTNYATYTPTG